MKLPKNLEKLKGDASSRIFYRNQYKKTSSIIVYSKKNKQTNLLNYSSVNKILIKNKILAPKMLSNNYSKNYIEIQDFGNQTVLSLFKQTKVSKFKIYKKIIHLLINIQSIRQKKVYDFNDKEYLIPSYKFQILEKEAMLFSEWYIKKKLKKKDHLKFIKLYNKIVKNLIKKIHFKNDTFVHRDFHISNLMIVKKKIGIIDSQDALIGNKAYDLASLIDDVRFRTSEKFKNKIFNLYLKKQTVLNKNFFKNDFDIISVLRNLKIIGIFTRLAIRDKKESYLKLIPHAWSLIKLRSKYNDNFKDLNNLIRALNNKIR